ncbi:MAG: threonine dehydratase [Planctomycetales bacterium]|nr:threonine dehydratase [Planctomycetales bacterium]
MLPTLSKIEQAASIVYRSMPATPQYSWRQLTERLGVELWIKHENHTPLGAFKVRGGLVYFDAMASQLRQSNGVICATRGNHGQSVAYVAAQHNLSASIVVPHGNSREKNAAMVSLGAKLIEYGTDFQEALEHAAVLARQNNLQMVPSFHTLLVAGVATYSLELFRAVEDLDVLYVPIGLGSGICGAIAARDALGLAIEIVAVVSSQAQAYEKSFRAKCPMEAPVTTHIADGIACRRPNEQALEYILAGVSRFTQVNDEEVKAAMRDIFECTHNVAEGAGAAAVAAVRKDAGKLKGSKVAAILSGGNVDRDVFASVLASG